MFPFKTSLNASTLFPFHLSLPEQFRIASEAGYDGIELWMKDVDAYVDSGGTIRELRQRLNEMGLAPANAIAFWKWADADKTERRQGLEQATREMERLAELGCPAAAAPPFGNVAAVSLDEIAEHYGQLAEVARSIGVEPYLEFWGRAPKLSRLSEALYVADKSGVTEAKILLDPFHMYTGGSRIDELSGIDGRRIGIVHVNDYPDSPARDVIADRDRLFPCDGIAPSAALAAHLHKSGYRGYLSLELFFDHFGPRSALEVAQEGAAKIRSAYAV